VKPAAPTAAPTEKPAPTNAELILATTTSTQDSGLLDVLIPMFTEQTGYVVKTVAVGSGQALQMGQEGNADVLFVHSPSAEKALMTDGFGKERFLVMHNYFMIVGPASDPAGISGAADANEAMTKIYEAGAPFASRGDESGTHSKELSLWKAAAVDPAGEKPSWYAETGQGMGATLTIASEKESYTLTDRGTFLATQANLDLAILYAEDPALINVYHVITVNPEKWPKVNYEGAAALAEWIIDPAIQEVIKEFGVQEFGESLFVPDADKTDADLGL
jgi:tungstate transport system substrate-binding protein